MHYRIFADALLVAHLAFIVFAIAGGMRVWWQRWWLALHVPAVAWGAWTEFTGTICPLTPWEQALLARAGDAGYRGGFIEHYVIPLIYPGALTPALQWALGIFVLAINALIYAA